MKKESMEFYEGTALQRRRPIALKEPHRRMPRLCGFYGEYSPGGGDSLRPLRLRSSSLETFGRIAIIHMVDNGTSLDWRK